MIQTYIAPTIGKVLGGALKGLGVIAEGVIKVIATVAKVITATVEAAIIGINALIKAYNAVPLQGVGSLIRFDGPDEGLLHRAGKTVAAAVPNAACDAVAIRVRAFAPKVAIVYSLLYAVNATVSKTVTSAVA